MKLPELCNIDGCRKIGNHNGNHDQFPTDVWKFMNEKDKKKLVKAGFATPRGGAKGAYQNHVVRTNKVIIPFERLKPEFRLNDFKDDYVIRLYPEQYFAKANAPKKEFSSEKYSWIRIGENAFILYRTHESFSDLPPNNDWSVRYLEKNGEIVKNRGENVIDEGHYVLRIPRLGDSPKRYEGPPQGLFAPEYANKETNYLCKCVLAWLIIHTIGSPYTTNQALWLMSILSSENLLNDEIYEFRGTIRHGLTSCPLCLRFVRYNELHETVSFEEDSALGNAPDQVSGATRSTMVNLFHLEPLNYDYLAHLPQNIAWGHAICNTHLGQRKCYSLPEIIRMGNKVGIIRSKGIETFGWISDDMDMIRSPNGSVWIQLHGDIAELDPPKSDS